MPIGQLATSSSTVSSAPIDSATLTATNNSTIGHSTKRKRTSIFLKASAVAT